MGNRLADIPWWIWFLVYTLTFASVRVGIALFDVAGPLDRLRLLAAGATVAGLVAGPLMVAMNRRADTALGPLSTVQAREAARAAGHGPVPVDPPVRDAAARLAEFRRVENQRAGRLLTACFGLTAGGCLIAAVTWTPLWTAVGLPVMVLLAHSFWLPVRLERRIAVLRSCRHDRQLIVTATDVPDYRQHATMIRRTDEEGPS